MAFHLNSNHFRIYIFILIPLLSLMTSCGDILNSDENVIKKDITMTDSSGWQKVSFSGIDEINKIYFLNERIGFLLCGDIYQTLDSGKSWSVFLRSYDIIRNDSLQITNFKVFDENTMLVSLNFDIYKTTNAGKTWNTVQIPFNKIGIYNNWDFYDLNNGMVASNYIYQTVDGGINWSFLDSTDINVVKQIFAFNDNIIISTANKVFCYNSKKLKFSNSFTVDKLYFADEYNGLLLTDSDSLFKTTDGGISWLYSSSPYSSNISSITCKDNYLWACGTFGEIFASDDGGASWSKQYQDSTYNQITAIHFYNNLFGWAGGRNGLLLRTATGGKKYASN